MQFFSLTLPFPSFTPSLTSWFINFVLYGILMAVYYFSAIRSVNNWNVHIPVYDYIIFAVFICFIDDGCPVNNILGLLFLTFLMYFTANPYHRSFLDQLTQLALILATLYPCLSITGNTWMHIAHHFSPSMSSPIANYETIWASITAIAVSLLLLKPLRPLFNSFLSIIPFARLWNVVVLAASVGSFFLVAAIGQHVIVLPTFILASLMVGYFLAFIFLIWDITSHYQKKQQVNNLNYELVNLRAYTSEIEAMYDNLRRFRHDYKNILFTLQEAINTGNIKQSKEILDRVVSPSEKQLSIGTNVLARLDNVSDLALKSLLYNKLRPAIEHGINLQLEVPEEISYQGLIDPLDLVRIVSILIDNAVTAATNSKDKVLNLSLFTKEDQHYLVIGNTTAEKQVALSTVSGSIKFGNKHGLGRRNLRMILARYPKIVSQVHSANHWFEQTIIIPK